MKRKYLTVILVCVLALATVLLSACKGDQTLPRKFTVSFDTNVDGLVINPVKVLEGYHITGTETDLHAPTYPDETQVAIFRGWFSDEDFTEPWDVDTYRVTEDMTLFAKWSFPTATPSEVQITSEAFSNTIAWLQTGVQTGTTFTVKLLKAKVTEKEAVNPNTGATVKYEEIVYPTSEGEIKTGTAVADGYNVYFTLDEKLAGGVYQATISSNVAGSSPVSIRGLRFKGTGTKADPYLVYNEADLKYVSCKSMGEDVVVKLKSNVTLHSVYSEKLGCIFDGLFDGDGYTVELKNNSALFYELGEHAEVKNVKFVGAISGSDPSIGVVANYNNGYIHNVESTAVSVTSQGGKVNDFASLSQGGAGGIVGTNKTKGRITLCAVTSGQANVIYGKIGVGGIAGVNYGTIYNFNGATACSAIVGAYNGKEISSTIANSFAGCAVGVNFGTISQVNVDGKINCRRIDLTATKDAGATNIGGVVGYNAQGGVVEQCLFQGMRCVGDTNVGGIAGYNDGTITSCFTGRRIRKPSGTTLAERMFISPVCGSYCVGGIAGKCGEHSVITNVFSTANVWCYGENAYTVAEKADNAIGVNKNQNPRLTSNYLGQTYGQVYSNNLVAPQGNNIVILDNTDRIGSVEHNLLGARFADGTNIENSQLIITYLTLLGDKFGYNNTYGISLLWQSVNTKGIDVYLGE